MEGPEKLFLAVTAADVEKAAKTVDAERERARAFYGVAAGLAEESADAEAAEMFGVVFVDPGIIDVVKVRIAFHMVLEVAVFGLRDGDRTVNVEGDLFVRCFHAKTSFEKFVG